MVCSLLICGSYHRHVMSEGYGPQHPHLQRSPDDGHFHLLLGLHAGSPTASDISHSRDVLACVFEAGARWLMRLLLHALLNV